MWVPFISAQHSYRSSRLPDFGQHGNSESISALPYLYRYVCTTLLIANAIITPAKRTRDRTIAIDINIIRGAYKTILTRNLARNQLIGNWRVILVCNR